MHELASFAIDTEEGSLVVGYTFLKLVFRTNMSFLLELSRTVSKSTNFYESTGSCVHEVLTKLSLEFSYVLLIFSLVIINFFNLKIRAKLCSFVSELSASNVWLGFNRLFNLTPSIFIRICKTIQTLSLISVRYKKALVD